MDVREAVAMSRPQDFVRRHPWEQARADILLSWLEGRMCGQGTVLDVGCGDGYVLQRVADRYPSFQYYGVDSALEDTFAAPDGVRLVRSLQDVPAACFPAAVVLLMDVLEHVEDAPALIQELVSSGAVGPSTFVVVTVPAFQSLLSPHDRIMRHYRRYSQSLLREHVERAGLRVDREGFLFLSLLFVRALEVLAQRMRLSSGSQDTGLVRWGRGALLSQFLRKCLVMDNTLCQLFRRTFNLTLPGLSCYALCSLG